MGAENYCKSRGGHTTHGLCALYQKTNAHLNAYLLSHMLQNQQKSKASCSFWEPVNVGVFDIKIVRAIKNSASKESTALWELMPFFPQKEKWSCPSVLHRWWKRLSVRHSQVTLETSFPTIWPLLVQLIATLESGRSELLHRENTVHYLNSLKLKTYFYPC